MPCLTEIDLVLASASPRRAELLQQIGVRFSVHPANIDESQNKGETPEAYVQRMAINKAKHVASQEHKTVSKYQTPILGADTTVVLENTIFSKPKNKTDAIVTLQALSGRSHRVLSAVAVIADGCIEHKLCETVVSFRTIKKAEYERYWSTGEPRGKAGAYAIQGMGAVFVDKIEGSYSSVVGLPLSQTHELFERFNIGCWNLV